MHEDLKPLLKYTEGHILGYSLGEVKNQDVVNGTVSLLKELMDELDKLRNDRNSPQVQVDKLAQFIMAEMPGEPSQSEGAVDTIIRWVKNVKNIHGPDPLAVPPNTKG